MILHAGPFAGFGGTLGTCTFGRPQKIGLSKNIRIAVERSASILQVAQDCSRRYSSLRHVLAVSRETALIRFRTG
ncbi:MAG: hypothetical protein MZU79_04185 [Anaerotruncus sp.]|nr:hypothetical protein [Anaerotruncus sp.]